MIEHSPISVGSGATEISAILGARLGSLADGGHDVVQVSNRDLASPSRP